MTSWIPPRLRPIVGADLDSVTAESIGNLVGLVEDTDLEFKLKPWESTEGGSKECALDIADKANAGGALIVVGVEEDGDGRAVRVVPVPPDGQDVGLRVHQIVAERLSPSPVLTHRQVDVDGGKVHLFAIAPTTRPPHGVAVGGHALRFPVRIGTTRSFLTEPELADRYQRRFLAATSQRERAETVHRDAINLVPFDRTDKPWSWLVISTVPEFPGRLALRRGLSVEWEQRISQALRDFPTYGRSTSVHVAPGFKCLHFSDQSSNSVSRFYTTGGRLGLAGDAAIILAHLDGEGSAGHVPDTSMVFDEHVVGDLINSVALLAQYALATGAVGYLSVSAELVSGRSMVLGEYRSMFKGQLDGTRQVSGTTGRSDHVSNIDELAAPGFNRVAFTRLLALDLFSAFGLPEVQQITAHGEFALDRFTTERKSRVIKWAESADVPTVEQLLS